MILGIRSNRAVQLVRHGLELELNVVSEGTSEGVGKILSIIIFHIYINLIINLKFI